MNIDIANSLSGYIETLYDININLVKLCGRDAYNYDNSEKLVLDIVQDIPRMIPYQYDKGKKKVFLNYQDGLLEFKDELIFLEAEYNNILESNYAVLDKARIIRNKYQHKMHNINFVSSTSGSIDLLSISFSIEGKIINIETDKLISLIINVNNLFSMLVKEIREWARANKKEDYKYYQRLNRFDFLDFNEIFKSNLLVKIGKVFHNI